jgi:hypothetical protein
MKINHNLAAALIMGLTSGAYQFPRGATSSNRVHTNRAPRGSAEEAVRLTAAEAKRARKAAKRVKS